MIGPKKKVSIAKKHQRHSTWQRLTLKKMSDRINYVKCTHCGGYKSAHRVCPHCGFYKGVQVLTIKTKSKETIIES